MMKHWTPETDQLDTDFEFTVLKTDHRLYLVRHYEGFVFTVNIEDLKAEFEHRVERWWNGT